MNWCADAVIAYQERENDSPVLCGLRDELAQNEQATANIIKAIEEGILTQATKNRLRELGADAIRIRDAITLEELGQTHFNREMIVYYLERFRGGDPDSIPFRRKVIDSLVNAVWLWDDHVRIAFNFSGKGSIVERELVMDADAVAGVEGLYKLDHSPPEKDGNFDRIAVLFYLC